MVWSETWKLALDALRSNRVKAALTMLGVVIGSACIVLVVTVANTGRRYVLAQIEGVGSNMVYANLVDPGIGKPRPAADEITLDDLEAIHDLSGVVASAGTLDTPTVTVIHGEERTVRIIGVTEGFQQIRNLLILHGRYFDQVDFDTRAKACLITEKLAARFQEPPEQLVGHTLRLGELELTIIGIFRERVSTLGQSEIRSESIIIPHPVMQYITGDTHLKTVYAQAASAEMVPRVTQAVQELLESRHRSEADYLAANLNALLAAAENIALALTSVLLVIALIALLISGIGIMNIMLVTVTERTQEIGIRMAIGAPRKDVRMQFLAEAFIISATGAFLGIALAVGTPMVLKPLLPPDLSIPVSGFSIILSFFVCCLVGIVFGYIPANRASKLQPREALQAE